MANVGSVTTGFFPETKEGFVTTTSGTVSSGATSVGFNSTAGYTNGAYGTWVIDPTDVTKKQVFTGLIDTGTNTVTGVQWTEGTNQTHTAGATVVDYETATAWNLQRKGWKIEHKDNGTHGAVTADSLSVSGAVTLSNNSIDANELAANAITLGYAQITSAFTNTSATPVQVTGLTSTVTIPAGGRRVKITAHMRGVYLQGTSVSCYVSIWDGTVGSGTKIGEVSAFQASGGQAGATVIAIPPAPSAGSKTYNVALQGNGTQIGNIEAAATYPAFLLVELI